MQVNQTIENVTLSLPNADMSMLRMLSRKMGWKMKTSRTKSTAQPPCQYTEEEVVQRVLKATADVDADRNLMTHEEFEKLVKTW